MRVRLNQMTLVLFDDVLKDSHTVNIRIVGGDTARTIPKADTLSSSIHAAGWRYSTAPRSLRRPTWNTRSH